MDVVFTIAVLFVSSTSIFVQTQDPARNRYKDRSQIPPSLRNLEPCEIEGYAEDPNNCARFFRCVNYGMEDSSPLLLRHKFKCAPGTVYDSDLSNCNHPDKMKAPPDCEVEIPELNVQPRQSRQRGRSYMFEEDSSANDSNVIQSRRQVRTKFRGSSNGVSEESDSAPGGDIDPQYLRPLPLVRPEFFNNFILSSPSNLENKTPAAVSATTKETTFGDYEEVTEPAPFVPHQIQVPYI